jgi:hypothetical protein
MNPPLPKNAFMASGDLHYLTTIEGFSIWWDDDESGTEYAYLVDLDPWKKGDWVRPQAPPKYLPPAVQEFIHNHASLL